MLASRSVVLDSSRWRSVVDSGTGMAMGTDMAVPTTSSGKPRVRGPNDPKWLG